MRDPKREKAAETIFAGAIEHDTPEAQAEFLDRACAGDEELRAWVGVLLEAHRNAGGFLAGPPSALAAAADDADHGVQTIGGAVFEAPGATIGRYKLLERIGEGGMGVVFMARQQEPVRRMVALKVIKAGMDTRQVIARFEAERQALALMDHPNIAKVLDGGTTDGGRPYFVMELVKGVPITDYCDQHLLTTRERLVLFSAVCRAVQHAHTKVIIHRDLKPTNVLVTLADGVPVPKVIDFGIAKAAGQDLTDKTLFTNFAQMVGTPLYMSPEQAAGAADVDTRSDVYALGVLLYELLTGTTPFDKGRLGKAAYDEIRRIIREEEPPRPSTRISTLGISLAAVSAQRKIDPRRLGALVRGELDWIVMRALEKDRARRYETASGLGRDVERYLDDEAVQACPPSAVYRFRKFARRHRGTVVAAGLILVSLLGGIAGTTSQAVRAGRERADAIAERNQKQRALDAERIASKAEAESRKATMAALGSLTDDVVERMMDRQPTLDAADRAFLEKILAHHEAFATLVGNAPGTRDARAWGLRHIGLVQARLGQRDAAMMSFRRARDMYIELAREFPEVQLYRERLGYLRHTLGAHLRQIEANAEAQAEFESALAIHQQIFETHPTAAVRSSLRATYVNLSSVLRDQKQFAQAKERCRDAVDVATQLVKEFPGSAEHLADLADSRTSLGLVLDDLNEGEKARVEFTAAISILEELTGKSKATPQQRQFLGDAHHCLGRLLIRLGEAEKANDQFRAARGVAVRLAADFPIVPIYRRRLGSAHQLLGNSLSSLGRITEAKAEYRFAIDLFKRLVEDFDDVPENKSLLAATLETLGSLQRDSNDEAAADTFRQAIAVREQLPRTPADTHKLAMVINVLGTVLQRTPAGRADAIVQYQRAIALEKQLLEEFPKASEYAIQLAGMYCNLGSLRESAGGSVEALQQFEEGLKLITPVLDREPHNPPALRGLRNLHVARGRVYEVSRRLVLAVNDLEQAVILGERLCKAEPKEPEHRYQLGRHCTQAARLSWETGKPEASIASLEKGLLHFKALASAFPGVDKYDLELGQLGYSLGNTIYQSRGPADALEPLGTAIATLAPVLRRNPNLANARALLQGAYWIRSQALLALNRTPEALRDMDKAIALGGDSVTAMRYQRAQCLMRAGDHRRAFTEAVALAAAKGTNAELLYKAAAICARTANSFILAGGR